MRNSPTTSRRRRHVLDIPLELERRAGGPPSQVHAALRAAILAGRFAAGMRLPSSRTLATQLGLRRNAVVLAYEQLQADGLADARTGTGTFVAARLPTQPEPLGTAPFTLEAPSSHACALGRTFADPILLRSLATAMRRRILKADCSALGYGDPRGSEALREQVGIHLAASRGIRCDPGCIVIVSGTQQGLRLCAEALLSPGDAVWFEDPGYPAARSALETAGLRLVAVPVDAAGIDVAVGRRRAGAARAAYVTPSNQFPTAVTMTMERRLSLIDWARENGSWIIEDDYDNEFRYEVPPLTALAGIGGDRVVYIGTFSKALFAGLRLAYMALPPSAVSRVVASRSAYDRFPPALTDQAVADLMADGTVAAHTRRMRNRYRGARDALAEALARAAAGTLRINVPAQGQHLLAYLPDDLPTDAAVQIRAHAGIEARLISEMRVKSGPPDGFVLGFTGHETVDLVTAGTALGRAARNRCR